MDNYDSIKQFMRDNLHGINARISSGAIAVEGTIEQYCHLEYAENFGLKCSANLEYNNAGIIKSINDLIIQGREGLNISYDQRDAILDTILPVLKTTRVQFAIISPYGITGINCKYKDGSLFSVVLQHKDGTILNVNYINTHRPV